MKRQSKLYRLAVMLGTSLLALSTSLQAETFYFHNDHLGTPQVLTDSDGAVVWKGSYSPFGEVDEAVDAVEQNIRFPGQYFEEETGLHYNYFRDYDPGTGRYIESDPIGLAGGVNTFGYVGGMPISNYDLFARKRVSLLCKMISSSCPDESSPSVVEWWPPNDEYPDRGPACPDKCSGRVIKETKTCAIDCEGFIEKNACIQQWRLWGIECARVCAGSIPDPSFF